MSDNPVIDEICKHLASGQQIDEIRQQIQKTPKAFVIALKDGTEHRYELDATVDHNRYLEIWRQAAAFMSFHWDDLPPPN